MDDGVPGVKEKPQITFGPASIEPSIENNVVDDGQLRKDDPWDADDNDKPNPFERNKKGK